MPIQRASLASGDLLEMASTAFAGRLGLSAAAFINELRDAAPSRQCRLRR